MLESASLLIHAWHDDGAVRTRGVADGASGAALGTVRWVGPRERSWFDWLRRQRFEVLETEDDALLLMLVRPWGLSRLWDVYDAEERRVGTIDGLVLLDSDGGRRANLDRQQAAGGRLLDPRSRVLAEYRGVADGAVLLTFAGDLEANPFLRMLLLGSVLIQDLRPAGSRQ